MAAETHIQETLTNERKDSDSFPITVALQLLDSMLTTAVDRADAEYGPRAALDALRGLHISRDDVQRSLLNSATIFVDAGKAAAIARALQTDRRINRLLTRYGLDQYETVIVLIALAPEIDLRYERIYAYLQDDVTKKRPTVALALSLLCSTTQARLTARQRFAADAPLIRHGLIHLIDDPQQIKAPLLARSLKLDDQFVRLLLNDHGLDSRLAPFCEFVQSTVALNDEPLPAETKRALRTLGKVSRQLNQPLRFYFQGPSSVTKRSVAESIANELGTRLLLADLSRTTVGLFEFDAFLDVLFREACLHDAVLYIEGSDELRNDDGEQRYRRVLESINGHAGIVVLAGAYDWVPSVNCPAGVIVVPFGLQTGLERRAQWESSLTEAKVRITDAELDALSERFSLTSQQIDHAVRNATARARWRAGAESATGKRGEQSPPKTGLTDLFHCARAQTGHDLAKLARKIEPKYSWDDLVLPEPTKVQLREICDRVVHRHQVLGDWGFAKKMSTGKGVNVLFSGSSGTGKTMAAEVIAAELGLDLFKIDLSQTVSKYIGDTEKNIERIFAATTNEILFFDEADALFGKRSEVKDAHDRFANIEVSYLLQKMEHYEGIAILATNLRDNLDPAFVRRLAFAIHFPFPDEEHRRQIWERVWPRETPLSDDVDLEFLAGNFKLSGGNIKNIGLAAAYLAAAEKGRVAARHIRLAIERECQKSGKDLSRLSLNSEHRGAN